MYKELSKARATLEHVESRRSELEAELASAKAKLVAHGALSFPLVVEWSPN